MHEDSSDIEEIKSNLTKCERRIMRLFGQKEISQHKNIRKETIKNRLPNKYSKDINKAIKSLINKKKLIRRYRNNNYALNSLCLKVAQSIKKDYFDEMYSDLSRILIIIP